METFGFNILFDDGWKARSAIVNVVNGIPNPIICVKLVKDEAEYQIRLDLGKQIFIDHISGVSFNKESVVDLSNKLFQIIYKGLI